MGNTSDRDQGDGSQTRPIGIPTFEDKVLQRAVAMLLEAVYEQDFLDCSYGFRPARSAHQALAALRDQLMVMGGGWSDLYVSLNWRDDLESLLVACTYDVKVPPARKDEVGRLLALINGQLFHGHFDMWHSDGSIVFRNNLVLSGGAVANDAQCETLIRLGIESCERYYPAVQYVCWAGQTAHAALESSLLETMGEA